MTTSEENTPEAPFDRAEAARRLGMKESWLRDHRNEVPFVRMGRFVRYTQEGLDAYVDRQTVDMRSKRRPAPRPTYRQPSPQELGLIP